MNCPECEAKLYCPCKHCVDKNEDKLLWEWIEGELIKCPECGFIHNADYWEEFEWLQYKGRKKIEEVMEEFYQGSIHEGK